MEETLLKYRSRLQRRATRALRGAVAAAFLIATTGPAWSWQTAHGKPDNTGFVDVETAPAKSPLANAPRLGSIAPGAGPVIAPDGTVYIGNEQGKLMSFKPDGTPGWSREVGRGQTIAASPAIGSDGTVYVVSVTRQTDDQVDPAVKRVDSTLHRFNSTGGYLGQTVFPDHNGGGGTTASPNLWRFNGVELVMVPAVYRGPVGGMIDIRLLAFSPGGAVVADQHATSITAETTGGGGVPNWYIPICLLPPIGPVICYAGLGGFGAPGSGPMPPPLPGVGIFTNPQGGTPWILLSDHYKDLVGLTFSLADNKFYEAFRVHENNRYMRSAPAILSNLHAIIGTEDIERDYDGNQSGAEKGGIVFSGPNLTKVAPVTGLQEIYGSPTRLKDGRVGLVGARGELTVLNNVTVAGKFRLPGASIASAAASRTHLFVSTTAALHTFDATSLNEVAKLDWTGGGMSPPVIGPLGHVYAIANSSLFVFPPPLNLPTTGTTSGTTGGPVLGGGVFQDSGVPAPAPATPQSQSYTPPLTANNNRLFACEKLDGDDCGKGDHRAIAAAFCAKSGYGQSPQFDVDSKKVKAETLDGRYCSKKKCKVFEEIVCAM